MMLVVLALSIALGVSAAYGPAFAAGAGNVGRFGGQARRGILFRAGRLRP